MDTIAMFVPISKWSSLISKATRILEIIRKAFKLAQDEKPSATVIEPPEDVAKEDVTSMPVIILRRSAADHKAIAHAVELIGETE